MSRDRFSATRTGFACPIVYLNSIFSKSTLLSEMVVQFHICASRFTNQVYVVVSLYTTTVFRSDTHYLIRLTIHRFCRSGCNGAPQRQIQDSILLAPLDSCCKQPMKVQMPLTSKKSL